MYGVTFCTLTGTTDAGITNVSIELANHKISKQFHSSCIWKKNIFYPCLESFASKQDKIKACSQWDNKTMRINQEKKQQQEKHRPVPQHTKPECEYNI